MSDEVKIVLAVTLFVVLAYAWIGALDRARPSQIGELPTARQRRRWRRERLKSNPRLRRVL